MALVQGDQDLRVDKTMALVQGDQDPKIDLDLRVDKTMALVQGDQGLKMDLGLVEKILAEITPNKKDLDIEVFFIHSNHLFLSCFF
jgi:hypothetical protein